MRIACVHIPQFALQCVSRLDPSLRRAPVVVVGAGLDPIAGTVTRVALHSPIVQACSRAAWALGIRLGMTATAARSLSPDLQILTGDASIERETIRAIADVLGGIATTDLGGRVGVGGAHLAMYVEVPSKTRGTSFGDRLVETLDELGFTVRVGIADDRFTAWVAAAYPVVAAPSGRGTVARAGDEHHDDHPRVISVPRGGSAAFLAPRPLSLLSISPEVQHMLEALGVRTLGEFAALPAPSVARPHVAAAAGADYQALARGESGNTLRPYTPDGSIREDLITSEALGGATALAILGSRLALRLAGRDRRAARIEISIFPPPGSSSMTARSVVVELATPVADSPSLVDVIGNAVGDVPRGARLRVAVLEEAFADGEAIATHDARTPMPMPMAHVPMRAPARRSVTPGQIGLRLADAVDAEAEAEAEAEDAANAGGEMIDLVPTMLGVVLATTGSQLDWQLTSPSMDTHAMRHRRMRRGKHRVRRAPVAAQSRLFKIDG